MTDDTIFINPRHLIELVKQAKAAKSGMEEISGEFGKRVKAAKDNGNLHPKAFRIACQIAREYDKEEANGDELRRQIVHYVDVLDKAGLLRRGDRHVGDIDDLAREAVAAEADRQDAAEAHVDGNVRRLESGIKTLTEDVEFGDAPGTYSTH